MSLARWRKYRDVRVCVAVCPTFVGTPVRVRVDGGILLHAGEAFRLRLYHGSRPAATGDVARPSAPA